jgi:beta-lactamase regulating signal transducer with metallopeptidase domain
MLAFPALPTSASAWLIALIDASAKSAVVLAAAALAAFAMRRASAALRHLVWALAIVSVLCLPFLSLLLPAWPVLRVPGVLGPPASPPSELLPEETLDAGLPSHLSTTAPSADTHQPPSEARPPAEPAASDPQPSRPSPSTPADPAAARPPRAIPSILLLIWSLGAAVALLPLLVGMHAVRRLTRRARPFTDPAWLQLLRAGAAQFALRRPLALLRSSPDTVPMMSGLLRPALLLPAGADAWPASRRRLVLLHELAHVKRGDYLFQILAHLAAAIYWFNPLAWLALHSLRREGERACDDLVLNAGFKPSDYAGHLLEITRGARGAAFCSIAAVPMARPTKLEGRVHAILDARRNRRGVTRPSALLAVLAVAAIAIPLARLHAFPAPTRLGEGPDGRPLYQWNPSESWPGDSLLDPRLDQPVHFWRAGLALSELFASIEAQTGVRLGFWPEGDENPRVRVNLYLNPDQPPTLRDLMAQLAWVTDCSFAWAERKAGEPGPSYYLLGTSIGRGVPRDVHVAEATAREQQQAQADRHAEGNIDEVRANLEKLRAALELSREEVIARYKGANDYLLLTLLYPPYRAAAKYVCKMVQPEQPLGLGFRLSTRRWDELTEDERALVREAFLQYESEDWPAKTEVTVTVDCFQPAGQPWTAIEVTAAAKFAEDPEGNTSSLLIGPPYLLAPTRDFALAQLERSPFEYMVALGQDIPKESDDREAYERQWETSIAKQRDEQELTELLADGALSPQNYVLLSGMTVPLDQGRPYALWELQQTVAAASGLNIVSDSFWQPRRILDSAGSALHALALSCRAFDDRALESRDPTWLAAWQWGDAGSFLRFRSTDRAVWRASLLPPDTLAQLDACLAPYLPALSEPDLPPEGVSLRFLVDLPQLFRVAASLDDLQLAYGGRLLYEDPTDPLGACRQALRQAFLDVDGEGMSAVRWGARSLNFFRLLASLTPGQWDLLRGQGLNCSQLNADQLARLRGSTHPWGDHEMEQPSRLLLEAEGPMPQAPPGASRDSLPPMIWKRVAPGHYQRVGDSREGPLPPHSFEVRLKHVAGEMRSVLPEGEEMEGSITSWSYDYQVEANVPGPLPSLTASAESP